MTLEARKSYNSNCQLAELRSLKCSLFTRLNCPTFVDDEHYLLAISCVCGLESDVGSLFGGISNNKDMLQVSCYRFVL